MPASPTALLVGLNLMGVLFNTLLYGLVLGQFLTYFNGSSRTKDPAWIRAIVWMLLILDTIHSGVEFYAVWDVAVTNYGDLASFAIVNWVIPFTATADAVAALLTQAFLLYRVHSLTRNVALVAFLGTTSVLSFAFGCTAGIYSGILGTVEKFPPLVKWVILWLSFQSVSDLGISGALIFSLIRSRTGFRKTDAMINRLIYGAIETGVFASVFAMGDLFSFTFFRQSNLYLTFAYPIGRIYTNTLLHVLNSRDSIRMTGGMATAISLGEVLTEGHTRGRSAATTPSDTLSNKQSIVFRQQNNGHGHDHDTSFVDLDDDASQMAGPKESMERDRKSRIMVAVEESVHVV
ncbi:hypothetical protein MIND_00571200 [Mycena indigotica]|uniref:DUF6534 domain-containing protein n=1 Tax=Mycena indigotica TaxID=2126181 RepID=A0A8H6SQ17_9AGAR|nr:uncharacterized protein MIND_00571200 [Mycena indigotica]KAF7303426.1 hypothetical protein MIND_00571200 [Mycena indigotica]